MHFSIFLHVKVELNVFINSRTYLLELNFGDLRARTCYMLLENETFKEPYPIYGAYKYDINSFRT